MSGRTYETVLNSGTVPTQFVDAVAQFCNQSPTTQGFGSILRSMTPKLVERSGLTSGATHKEALPGRIFGVVDAAGTGNLTIIHAGSAGAGEVLVKYNVSGTEPGIPSLTFGDGANTGYWAEKAELPAGFDELFDAIAV